MNVSKKNVFSELSPDEKKRYIRGIVAKHDKKKYPANENDASKHDYYFWSNLPHARHVTDMFYIGEASSDSTKCQIDEDKYGEYVTEQTSVLSNDICSFLNIHMYDKTDLKIYYNTQYLDYLTGNDKCILLLKTKEDMKIIGVLCGGIKTFRIGSDELRLADVRVMCIHKNFRNNRLAEFMMKKYINIIIDTGLNKGIYFTDVYTHIPNTKLDLYYRPINYEKIFSCRLDKTLDKKLYEYNLGKYNRIKYVLKNIVPYEKNEHFEKIYELYLEYMNKYNIYWIMDKMNFDNIVSNNMTYILTDNDNNPLDFFVLGKIDAKYNKTKLKVSIMLLYTNNSVKHTVNNILSTATDISKKMDIDMMMVYNNLEFDEISKETDGDYIKTNTFRYINLYNWLYPKVNQVQIGFV